MTMNDVIDARCSGEELAAFLGEAAFELLDADFTEMRDETGAPVENKPNQPMLLMRMTGGDIPDTLDFGETVTMPCRDLEVPWRRYPLRAIPDNGVVYCPCEGVKIYFSWRPLHQKWCVQLQNTGNADVFKRLSRLLEG
ncbi:MAG TPA: hypothetical protein VFZ58_00160 [Candidatus Saccharimonadales bacterium]